MNKPETATKYLRSKILRRASLMILVLAAAMPSATLCKSSEDAKNKTLQKVAQEWIQVGTEQHKRSLFEAAEKSFRQAAVYRRYLTDADRKKLDGLLEKSANAALAKGLSSVSTKATDKLVPPTQPVEAEKVVPLDTKAVEVRPHVQTFQTKADSIKEGKLLTRKEWEYMAEELISPTRSSAKQVKLPSRSAQPARTGTSTETTPGPRIVFEPGDEIEVKFLYTPQFNTTQTVPPDGKISLQLIPEVMAQGKTAAELRDELIRLYDPHLRAPEISVVARSFYNRRVFVGGQVLKPGVLQMPGPMTALEAIMEVGGFDLRAAERKSVIVIRYSGGRRYA
ncbi:MAG: polysaccharide biosynthesis/export family protein, partial [Phycisphaerales bacterium]